MNRRICLVVLVFSLIALPALAGVFSWLDDPQAPGPRSEAVAQGLELTLAPPQMTVKASEPVHLSIAFANKGPYPLKIVRPLDGTEARWQQPFHDFLAQPEGGATLRRMLMGGRAAKMQALAEDDLLNIEPAQALDPRTGAYAEYLQRIVFPQPGTYKVWYLYAYEAASHSRDVQGQPADDAGAVRGTFTSNAVTVIVQ